MNWLNWWALISLMDDAGELQMTDAVEPKAIAPKAGEPKPNRDKWWWGILLLVIGAVLSQIGSWSYDNWTGRLRYIQYVVQHVPGIISKPELDQGSVTILLDERPVDNLSTVKVSLLNTSDQDYEDLPVIIRLAPVDGEAPKFAQEPRSTSPIFKEFFRETEPDGGVLLSYVVNVANRSDRPVFEADYLLEGSVAPQVYVQVQKKGLEASEAKIAPRSDTRLGLIWLWIIGAAATGALIVKIIEEMRARRSELVIFDARCKLKAIHRLLKESEGRISPDELSRALALTAGELGVAYGVSASPADGMSWLPTGFENPMQPIAASDSADSREGKSCRPRR